MTVQDRTRSRGGVVVRCPTGGDLTDTKLAWLVWGLPAALFLAGLLWAPSRVWLWVPSLLVAGTACLLNARGCARRHCFFTGPLYLLGAVATLVKAMGMITIGWSWIAIATLAGTAIAFTLEYAYGTYVCRSTAGRQSR